MRRPVGASSASQQAVGRGSQRSGVPGEAAAPPDTRWAGSSAHPRGTGHVLTLCSAGVLIAGEAACTLVLSQAQVLCPFCFAGPLFQGDLR